MKAMVLAAGVGSRLRPLTDATPKALVDIGGKSMLERVVERLRAAGASDIIVNAHHHADQVEAAAKRLGLAVSREDDALLDTGGGLKKAAWFFDDGKPFLVHNVDVVSDLDLRRLYAAHAGLATLAVRDRPTTRFLVFRDGRLVSRDEPGERLGFDGVQVVSPELLKRLTESGAFSLTQAYLRLAKEGADIRAFRSDKWTWLDIGTPEKLEQARSLA